MSIREKFFNSMRRKDGRFIPFEFDLCPSKEEEYKKKTGSDNYMEYFRFPIKWLSSEYVSKEDKFSRYYSSQDDIAIDDWGVGYKKGSVAHFTEMQHPLKGFDSVEEFANYPYPDPVNDYKWDDVPCKVKSIKEQDLIAVAGMQMTIFEIAWYLRGMDNFMIDMVMNPELANYHLDRIEGIRCEFAKRYASAGCDVLSLGDDIATQRDMMMNPDMWREYLKPRLANVIKAAKDINPDILIAYHSDGNLMKVIPELIEVGVEILNPIQSECMDPVEIKKKYGDRLSFWGTVGTQTTMPFGTPDEVRKVCLRMIEEVGKGGGLLLAPTHLLEPEVPWENIQAFIDTINEYNSR